MGTKIGDIALLNIDDAIAQWNQHIALPLEPDEIVTVIVGYNTTDYLYDTIPVYDIYYRINNEITNTMIPAVAIDSDLFYAHHCLCMNCIRKISPINNLKYDRALVYKQVLFFIIKGLILIEPILRSLIIYRCQ